MASLEDASRRSFVRRGSEAHESLESLELRASLQKFLHTHARGPLVVLELLRFNFGWSTFPAALVAGAGLDDAVRARPLNSVGLSGDGLGDLAALLGVEGGVGEAVARECAGSMNRPTTSSGCSRTIFTQARLSARSSSIFGTMKTHRHRAMVVL